MKPNISATPAWIGPLPDGLKRWTYKKEMPILQAYQIAWRINFGLYGLGECPVFSARLATPGHVIGMRDMQLAGNRPWAEEWRTAFYERSMERVGRTP